MHYRADLDTRITVSINTYIGILLGMCCLVREGQRKEMARRRVKQKAEQPNPAVIPYASLVSFYTSILLFSFFICLSCAPSHSCRGECKVTTTTSERKKSEQKKEPEERPERNTAVFPNRVVLKQGNGKWDQSKNKQELLYFENKTEGES